MPTVDPNENVSIDLLKPSSTEPRAEEAIDRAPASSSPKPIGVDVASLPCLHPRIVCMLEVEEDPPTDPAASEYSLVLVRLGCQGGNPGLTWGVVVVVVVVLGPTPRG